MPNKHNVFRLAADVVQAARASGKVYNARVLKVQRDTLVEWKL